MTQSVSQVVEFNGTDIDDHEYYGDHYIFITDQAGREFRGLTPGPTAGEEIKLFVIGPDPVLLVHDALTTTAGNRLYLRDPDSEDPSFVGRDRVLYPGVPYWLVYNEPGITGLGPGWYGEGTGDAPPTPAVAVVNGSTADPTNPSGTSVIPQMTTTVTTTGKPVFVAFDMTADVHHNDSWTLAFYLDGSIVAGSSRSVSFESATGLAVNVGSIPGLPITRSRLLTDLSAGQHTIDVRWTQVNGVARAVGMERTLSITER